VQAGRELPGDHGRAPVTHDRARQADLLQGLTQAVDEVFGPFVRLCCGGIYVLVGTRASVFARLQSSSSHINTVDFVYRDDRNSIKAG
jgi:hypothetical protein